MNDFENELKRLLNEQVDAEVGPRRSPPEFNARHGAADSAARRWFGADRAPWVLPLVAAACVAVVVGGTFGAVQLLADDGGPAQPPPAPSYSVEPSTTAPAPVSPTATSPTATSGASTSAQASNSPSTSRRTETESTEPTFTMVTLGEATIAVPDGWVATHTAPDEDDLLASWCLHPRGTPVFRPNCALEFVQIRPPGGGPGQGTIYDVDEMHWANGNIGQFCSGTIPRTEETGDRSFGGRQADWRRWTLHCSDGRRVEVEQYVVASESAYALFSQHADATVHDAMAVVAQNSTLPAQSAPLRFMDRGIVVDVQRDPDRVTVTIDRVVLAAVDNHTTVINNNPATYSYPVPTSLFDGAGVKVGDSVRLTTNGHTVLDFVPDY